MQNTTKVCQNKLHKKSKLISIIFLKEAKELLGQEVLADTRAETKRRQAAADAKKKAANAPKPKAGRKPALKRLGTMAKTAKVGFFLFF